MPRQIPRATASGRHTAGIPESGDVGRQDRRRLRERLKAGIRFRGLFHQLLDVLSFWERIVLGLQPSLDRFLRGLLRLEADSVRGHLRARKVVADAVKDMKANSETPPEPLSSKRFSGKFMVRIPPELHRKLALEAQEEGISLNRLASDKLSSKQDA